MKQPARTLATKRPEVVIGLVGAIGVDLGLVESALTNALAQVAYDTEILDLMEILIEEYPPNKPIPAAPAHATYHAKMNLGNAFRKSGGVDAMALLGVAAIQRKRSARARQMAPTAYVLHQLKTEAEVHCLRRIYGSNCVIISAYAPRTHRELRLARAIAKSTNAPKAELHRADAADLVLRDQAEALEHGQNVQAAFPLADFFVDVSQKAAAESSITRFFQSRSGRLTPNRSATRSRSPNPAA